MYIHYIPKLICIKWTETSLKNQPAAFILNSTEHTTGYKLKMKSLVFVIPSLISTPVQWLYGSQDLDTL